VSAVLEVLPLLVTLLAAAAGYAIAARRIWARHGRRALPPARVACFALGLLVLAGALIGPLDDAADERFSLHMVQHILIVVVAAPLLTLGTPITALVLALPAAIRRRTTTPVLRSPAVRSALSPTVAVVLFVVVLCGSHVPAIYDAAVANQALHDAEHLVYLCSAMLFWMAVLGGDIGVVRLSDPARLLYLFFAMTAMAIVGVALTMSRHPLYPYYVTEARAASYSALTDQHTGGAIMWTSGMVTVVPVLAAVVLAWLAEDERRTVRSENRQQHASVPGGPAHR
jgi:putative membrane protein